MIDPDSQRAIASNGMPLFRLHYRSDDGGPLYGKDSRLLFTAPADGEYVVRIAAPPAAAASSASPYRPPL